MKYVGFPLPIEELYIDIRPIQTKPTDDKINTQSNFLKCDTISLIVISERSEETGFWVRPDSYFKIFNNSFSPITSIPKFFAFLYFDPGSFPTTT